MPRFVHAHTPVPGPDPAPPVPDPGPPPTLAARSSHMARAMIAYWKKIALCPPRHVSTVSQ